MLLGRPVQFRDASDETLTPAAEALGAGTLREARRLARAELRAARACTSCRWFLLHAPRVTSMASPRALVDQVLPWERDEHLLRLAAAWILLQGT
jgi:hypothetical protein